MNRIATLLIISFLLAFPIIQKGKNVEVANETGVIIKQDDLSMQIDKNSNNIKLKKKQFTIEFDVLPNDSAADKFYAAQIAATSNVSNLQYFKEGAISTDNPFYSPGTGLAAASSNQYEALYVGDGGHHYIYYMNEGEKRAQLMFKKPNGKLHLKWDVNKITFNGSRVNIEQTPVTKIYMMIFTDNNLNKKIEPEEYNLITIEFEP